MGRLGYAKQKKQRRGAADAVSPYVPPRCKFHPRKTAAVCTKLGDAPMVDLCDECYHAELEKRGMTIKLKEGIA